MGIPKDLTGKRFGRLTMIEPARNDKYGRLIWKCRCDCGNITYKPGWEVTRGHTTSCGCLWLEKTKESMTTHGKTKTRLYRVWKGMRGRCNNPKNHAYERYGGRGIKVCEEWQDFSAFEEWAMKNGYDPLAPKGVKTIDRIDVNGDYSPSNCRFVDYKTQSENRRNTIRIEINGETKTLLDWCRVYGVDPELARSRYKRGVTGERLFFKGDLRGAR